MVDTSNQIRTVKQWFLVLGFMINGLAMGCGGDPLEAVYGKYRIDETHQFDGIRFDELAPIVKQSIGAIARQLNNTLVYEFGPSGCNRIINGRKRPFVCEFLRIEKQEIAVFRSIDDAERTRYLRLTPTKSGVTLDDGITSTTLERIK